MKSLLLTTSTLPRFDGDPEPRFILDLALALSKYYRVTVLAPADPAGLLHEWVGEVEIIRYRYAPFRSWEKLAYPGAILLRLRAAPWLWPLVPMMFAGLYFSLRRELRRGRYDLVHCHWLAPQGVVQAYGFGPPFSTPYVVTSHGGDLNALDGTLAWHLLGRVMDRAAGISVVSRQLQDKVVAAGHDAQVIPMGVDVQRFGVVADERTPSARKTILFVGRLAEKKGVKYLVEAMASPELQGLGCQLLVIGDGPEKTGLVNYAEHLSVSGAINFLGAVDHANLPAYYAMADVFCAPSVIARNGDMEGLPTVILEASAAGVPCVGTGVGGIADFIEHDANGCLVQPGDSEALAQAIARILGDADLRARLSLAARASALEYDWPVIAQRFSEFYEKSMNRGQVALAE